jgi:DNA polymerase-3 subunit beta
MKLTIERPALVKALNTIKGATERRNTIPILANVLINADDHKLKLTATDLDIEFTTEVVAEVAQSGSITVDADRFRSIISKIAGDANLSIEATKEHVLQIKGGRARFSLNTLPASDYPSAATPEDIVWFDLPSSDLKKLIGRSQFAISTEETRYYLNGIYLHVHKRGETQTLRAVATDGHRLAQVDVDRPDGAEFEGVLIPRKTCAEALKIAEIEGTVRVGVSKSRVIFQAGSSTLNSKLIDGQFPDYQRVVPLGNDVIAVAATRTLAESVDRVVTVSTEKSRASKLTFDIGSLALECVNPDTGSAREELDVDFEKKAFEIGFNSRYLGDVLGQIAGEKVEIAMADAGSPTLFRCPTDASVLYVLMPMRT